MSMRRRNSGIENVNPNYGSTYRIEADQKQVIIGKLKADAQNLRKNEQEFHLMKDQHAELERKYRVQQEEKNLQDAEFKNKHQSAIRHICQLKNEVDAMRVELRDKKMEITDLHADSESLKGSLDQRNIQIDKCNGDISSLLADADELEAERRALLQQQDTLRKTNAALKDQVISLDRQEQSVDHRLAEMQKYSQQLEIQSNLLKEKIKDFEHQNNELDGIIQDEIQEIAALENDIYDSQAELSKYQSDNASLSANVEQYRSEAIHNQKATQAEIMRNNDLSKNIKQAENILKVRRSQVEEGRVEISVLRNENDSLDKINSQLVDDLEACKRHLEQLGLLNHNLVSCLQRFSEEDRNISQLIDRRPRVEHMRSRVNETNVMEYGKATSRTDVTTPRSTRRGSRY